MTDVKPITEFDIHFDEGAPRHNVFAIIEARAIELLKQHGIGPDRHILLMPLHSLNECPEHHGDGAPTYRFDLCICRVIRILVCAVSDEVIEEMQKLPGGLTRWSQPIDEGGGN